MNKTVKWGTFVVFGLITVIGFYLRSQSWIETTVMRPIQGDASEYFYYAYNLRYHHTYSREVSRSKGSSYKPTPDAVRSPGYPLVLMLLIDSPPGRKLIKKIQLFQMLLSTLTLILGFFLFRLYMPPSFAGVAALLTALSPHLIMFNSYILSESLFCFMLALLGLLWCGYAKHATVWFSTLTGAIMGLAALVRPSLQFFPLVAAGIVMHYYGRPKGLKLVAALILGFLLILSPWFIRNLSTLGKISDKSLMINFLHHGMYPDFKYDQLPETYRRPYKFDPRSEEINKNLISVMREIKNRLYTDPVRNLKWILLKKPAVFWSWDMVQGHGDVFVYDVSKTPFFDKEAFQWTHRFMRILHGPLVVMSLLGSILVWVFPQSAKIDENIIFIGRFIGALLLYYTILHMIGAPFPRYSVPLRPFQYGMALFCLHFIYKLVKTRKLIFSFRK